MCISRDVGAGGEDVGRAVASQLGFRYVDEEIVRRVAEESGLDHARVAGAEERRGLVARLLDAVEQSAAGLPEPYIYAADVQLPAAPGEDVRELIREAVRQTADDGGWARLVLLRFPRGGDRDRRRRLRRLFRHL